MILHPLYSCIPTGVQINSSSQILISRTAARAVFETPNAYYIPGVPYRGKVTFPMLLPSPSFANEFSV